MPAPKSSSLWQDILDFKRKANCTCRLRSGMDWWDLLKVESCRSDGVCPVLARYRDRVAYPGFDDPVRVELERELGRQYIIDHGRGRA